MVRGVGVGHGGVVVRGGVALVREVNAEFAAHDFVVIEIADGGGGGFGVRVFGEAEAFGTAGFTVVHEAEGDDAAGGGEDFGDLLFGEAWGVLVGCGGVEGGWRGRLEAGGSGS